MPLYNSTNGYVLLIIQGTFLEGGRRVGLTLGFAGFILVNKELISQNKRI